MDARKAFIFFGPPGAGKGTISRKCVEQLGWLQLSTGDLFRKHIKEHTVLGESIEKAIAQGKLVDDVTVMEVVYEWILHNKDKGKPLIFDGFPRTIQQAQMFLEKMKKNAFTFQVIKLAIADEKVIERLLKRRTCQNYSCQKVYAGDTENSICKICGSPLYQRPDDMEHTIKNRLMVYHTHANELLRFYETHGVEIKKINADQPVDIVFNDVLVATGERT